MQSIGINLEPYARRGILNLQSSRPSVYGLEMHLVHLYKLIQDLGAKAVIIDPVTSLLLAGNEGETRSLLVRMIDLLKMRGITALMTSLTSAGDWVESTDVGISSLIDTWITLDNIKAGGERNRILQIVKSRGMNHSNQLREFMLSGRGVGLKDVYLGSQGVLTGSARLAQEGRDRDAEAARRIDSERRDIALQVEEKSLQARIQEIEDQIRSIGSDRKRIARQDRERGTRLADEARLMSLSRKVSPPAIGRGLQKGRS
jgi:circadian clock protein KaiC